MLQLLARRKRVHAVHATEGAGAEAERFVCRYTLSSEDKLVELSALLESITSRRGAVAVNGSTVQDLEGLTALIRVGVHRNVGVDFSDRWTMTEQPCTVQQVYCSACSCSYSGMSNQLWQKFARMVLHANYEATLLAAADHAEGSGHVFLTFIGGGVFRNDMAWIVDAIARAVWNVSRIPSVQLQVHVCHYREVQPRRSPALQSITSPFLKKTPQRPFTLGFARRMCNLKFTGEYRSGQGHQLECGAAAASRRAVTEEVVQCDVDAAAAGQGERFHHD